MRGSIPTFLAHPPRPTWQDVRRFLIMALTAVPLTPVRIAQHKRYHAQRDTPAFVQSPLSGEMTHER